MSEADNTKGSKTEKPAANFSGNASEAKEFAGMIAQFPQRRDQVYRELLTAIQSKNLGGFEDLTSYLEAAQELGFREGYALAKALSEKPVRDAGQEQIKEAIQETKKIIVGNAVWNFVGGPLYSAGCKADVYLLDEKNPKTSPWLITFAKLSGDATEVTVSSHDNGVNVVYEKTGSYYQSFHGFPLYKEDLQYFNTVFDIASQVDSEVTPILIDNVNDQAFTDKIKIPQTKPVYDGPSGQRHVYVAATALPLPGTQGSSETITRIYDWKEFYEQNGAQKDLNKVWQNINLKEAQAKQSRGQ